MQIGSARVPYRLYARTICTWDAKQWKFRFAKVCWAKNGGPRAQMQPAGYSASITFSLIPKLVELRIEFCEIRVTFCGLQMHYVRSYGSWEV